MNITFQLSLRRCHANRANDAELMPWLMHCRGREQRVRTDPIAVRMHCGPQRRQKGNAQNQKCSISERSNTNHGSIHMDLASRFSGDLSHDTICAMTVVIAMPVAKAKLRAKITKIVFIIVSTP